ncbi:MAG: hypothetical protein WCI46_04930 [Verrucomicrobiota bacterium]
MKLPWLVLPLVLVLGSCKDQAKRPLPESAAEDAKNPQPETTAPKVALPSKATAQQLGSLLRVRVSAGGLPPQDVAAALLHREELPQGALRAGPGRFVLALLPGWEEAQLRDPSAKVVVYRNKIGGNGAMTTSAYPARLVQFETASGLALLTYSDTFEYGEDVGFRLERTAPKNADLAVLRTFSVAPPPATPPPWANDPRTKDNPQFLAQIEAMERMRVPIQPFSADFGAYRAGKKRAVELPALAPPSKADDVHLAVGGPDKLLAFVAAPPGGPVVVTPVDKFVVGIKKQDFKVGGIKFQRGSPNSLTLSVDVTPAYAGSRLDLRVSEVTPGAAVQLPPANADGSFDRLEKSVALSLNRRENQPWETSLNSVRPDREQVFLMQLCWPLVEELDGPKAASGYSRPFVVRLQHRTEGLYPVVEGLDGPEAVPVPAVAGVPAPAPAAEGEATPFLPGAAVRNVLPMAGGREVLLELEGAPYWRRFSFEKNDWLPLPAGDLTDVHLAGNLSALFVLDRKAGEVRKFTLSDLQAAGAAKLPADFAPVAILAGSNSDLAPVHVLGAKDALALAPTTMQRCDLPNRGDDNRRRLIGRVFGRNERYFVSGDGWSFTAAIDQNDTTAKRIYFYDRDLEGLVGSPDGRMFTSSRSYNLTGVSGEYWVEAGLRCAATADGKILEEQGAAGKDEPVVSRNAFKSLAATFKSLAPNSPVLFRVRMGNREAVPPVSPTVELFSYFDHTPFATVGVAELAEMPKPEHWSGQRWIYFDPYSLRLGTLAKDRKTWFVRKLTSPEQRDQPVLLNWPDTTFARGAEFRFQPKLLGGKKFTAEVVGRPGLAVVNETDGTVRLAIPVNEVATLLLLTVKVPGKDGSELAYAIPLRGTGSEPMLAAPIATERKGIGGIGKAFAQLSRPTSTCRALASAIYQFAEPIEDMQGPVSGCLALISQQKVEFLSLATRQAVGTMATAPAAFYYAGAGALFEYDRDKRTLTRITVPDGRRGAVLSFPANVSLTGIGMGTELASPLTLAVSVKQSDAPILPGGKRSQLAAEPTRLGDQVLRSDLNKTVVTIRNSQTLQAAGLAQPVELHSMLTDFGDTEPILGRTDRMYGYSNRPITLPASQNGIIVNLPRHLLAISPAQVFVCPFGEQDRRGLDFRAGWGLPGGSISGLMATSPTKGVFKGGWPVGRPEHGASLLELGGTPCGRYRLLRPEGGNWEDACLEICASENSVPLLLVARLPLLSHPRRIVGLGNDGPLAILDEKGQRLQILDFNLPAMMKELAPDDFHVTSQPRPCVVQGTALQYQVEVNNPAAVQTYRLQSAVPGAQLSPQGLLQYTPPMTGAEGRKANIAIEVVGKNGKVFLHEFPLYILPVRAPANPPSRGAF